jgi:hypothetical protein
MEGTGTMIVSARKSGQCEGKPGAGYGIRIHPKDRDAHFQRGWKFVFIRIEDGPSFRVVVRPSFWKRCPDLTHAKMGEWLLEQGLASWPKGTPPTFELEPMGEREFNLSRG